ncbi:UvrB/UvrC motif-containing protein [bacterium]|nr:UvrB/UvrC motif-containing protein [bacterium]
MIKNKKEKLHLCQECAEKLGVNKALSQLPHVFVGLVLDILKEKKKQMLPQNINQANLPVRHSEEIRCSYCGAAWEDFKRTGFLGCDKCYQYFHSQVEEVLRQIHGNTRHIGNNPRGKHVSLPEVDIVRLRKALNRAIRREEYEKAAELRDKIRELESKIHSKNS